MTTFKINDKISTTDSSDFTITGTIIEVRNDEYGHRFLVKWDGFEWHADWYEFDEDIVDNFLLIDEDKAITVCPCNCENLIGQSELKRCALGCTAGNCPNADNCYEI